MPADRKAVLAALRGARCEFHATHAVLAAILPTPEPLRCKQCGGPCEEARRCYATPVCFACLPPPESLPVQPAPVKP